MADNVEGAFVVWLRARQTAPARTVQDFSGMLRDFAAWLAQSNR